MSRVVLAVLIGLAAGVAHAADKPDYGPPAAWVQPLPAPSPTANPDGAAVRILAYDQQERFGPEGSAVYSERYVRVQSGMGLGALGSLTFSWRPETGGLTIHKVRILRGDKVIDVLATQSFTILRRENNLEMAMLDGVLSATLQPEGLQPGDILDVATTVTDREPVIAGKVESLLAAPAGLVIDHLRLRATWPSDRPVRWRFAEDFPQAKPVRAGADTTLQLDLKALQPLHGPEKAPARFSRLREMEISEFADWGAVSALLAPHYAKAATLSPDSPLKAEAAKIRAISADPKTRAQLALALVQDQVRYFFLGMNDGGLVPAQADVTWSRRFGDCKGKTVLLLALLHELDIEAQPALVSTSGGDGLDARLPSVGAFDHVLVRARIGGRDYWLDGTRTGDLDLDRIRTPAFHWALPVQVAGAALVSLERSPLATPETSSLLRIDASKGLDTPAPAHAEMVIAGDAAQAMNFGLSNSAAADRDRLLRAMWKGLYPTIEPKTLTATFDPKAGEEKLVLDGEAKMEWKTGGNDTRWYEVKSAQVGWDADFAREPGSHADAPFVVAHPTFTRSVETVILPRDGEGFTTEGADVDAKLAGYAIHRTAKIEKGVFTAESSLRSLAPEFPAAEAAAAETQIKEMANVRVWVRSPPHYVATETDVAALMTTEPKTAQDYILRAGRLMDRHDHAKAIADLDKAVALEPKNSLAYANRGLAHFWRGEIDKAKADVDKAVELDGHNVIAVHGQGMLAMREGRYADAVAAFSRSMDMLRNDGFAFFRRAQAYLALGEDDKALADVDELLKIYPSNVDAYLFRAQVLQARRQTDKALADLDAIRALRPADPRFLSLRGGLLATAGRPDEAQKAFADAIALKPTAEVYLSRAYFRAASDRSGKLGDIAEALKLDPRNIQARLMRAHLQATGGEADKAVSDLTAALKDQPDSDNLLTGRAEAYAKAGKLALAAKDYAQLRAKAADSPEQLNNICWSQATMGVALDAALADCDASLKINPHDAAVRDSRAFTLLRLGRMKEAVTEYDAALALRRNNAASYYGRGVAKLRLGLAADGQADLATARGISALVDAEFADYGVMP